MRVRSSTRGVRLAVAGVAIAAAVAGCGRSPEQSAPPRVPGSVAEAELVSAAESFLAADDKTAATDRRSAAAGADKGKKAGHAKQRDRQGKGNGHGGGVGRGLGPALSGRVMHGEFSVRTKDGFATGFVQRGEVTASTATSLTVESADGYTRTYVVSAASKVRPKPAAGSPVAAVGVEAVVIGTRDGKADTVRRVQVRKGNAAKPKK